MNHVALKRAPSFLHVVISMTVLVCGYQIYYFYSMTYPPSIVPTFVSIDHPEVPGTTTTQSKIPTTLITINNTSDTSTVNNDQPRFTPPEFHVLFYSPLMQIPISVREYVLGSHLKPKIYYSLQGIVHIHYQFRGSIDTERDFADYDAIFSTFPPHDEPVPPKRKGQLFVAWICENACLYPNLSEENVRANYPTIDYTISTSRKSSWWYSWTGAWPLAGLPNPHNITVLQTPPLPVADKKPAVLAIYSNCHTASKREVYLRELSKYFPVESRGKCSLSVNNHQNMDPNFSFENFAEMVPRKLNQARQYLFSAAMENAICPDYVSEKVFQSLAVGSVPIFLGAPNAKDYVPFNSTIFASDYPPEAMANYLWHLVNNTLEHESFLKWKQSPISNMESHMTRVWEHSIDHILEALLGFLRQGAPSKALALPLDEDKEEEKEEETRGIVIEH